MVGRKKKTRPKEDRISQLPDHLICHILTLVSTKDVVRTSVYSTRWRNLWQIVPGLDFNSREFGSFTEFVSFAGRFFDFHKDSWIQKLCLSIHDQAGSSDLTSWIDVVTRRRIQHLDISVYNVADFVDIPLSLYTCGTLVHLRLFGLTVVNAEFVSLPCVKLIDLQYNRYPNYEAILLKLISGSPVLEDLTIIRGWSEKPKVLQVRSKTLKRIHINEYVHVVIDAPLLQCLKTSLYYTKNVTIINSGFPAKVDIDFLGGALNDRTRVIRDILTDISRVRELVISCFSWEDIFPKSDPRPFIQFCYLSRLSVTFCYSDLGMLPNLLKSCPKLESLILELTANRLSIGGPKNREPKVTFQTIVIPCLVSSLKFVELKSPILGYEGEMDLVRYFLKNSIILEKLRVRFSGSQWRPKRRKATNVILKELIAMPRCSSACELLVD